MAAWPAAKRADIIRYSKWREDLPWNSCTDEKMFTDDVVGMRVPPISSDASLSKNGHVATKLELPVTLPTDVDMVSLLREAIRENKNDIRSHLDLDGKPFVIYNCARRSNYPSPGYNKPVTRAHVDLLKFPLPDFIAKYGIRNSAGQLDTEESKTFFSEGIGPKTQYTLLNLWVCVECNPKNTLAVLHTPESGFGDNLTSRTLHPGTRGQTSTTAVKHRPEDMWAYLPAADRPPVDPPAATKLCDAVAFYTARTPHQAIESGKSRRISVEFRILVKGHGAVGTFECQQQSFKERGSQKRGRSAHDPKDQERGSPKRGRSAHDPKDHSGAD